jgi:hypothetical protein
MRDRSGQFRFGDAILARALGRREGAGHVAVQVVSYSILRASVTRREASLSTTMTPS